MLTDRTNFPPRAWERIRPVTVALFLLAFPGWAAPAFGVQGVRLEPTPHVRIPSETRDGQLLFADPVGATVRHDGAVIVADRQGERLLAISRDGRIMAQFGRTGEGPGEYRTISWMSRCGEGRIAVFDQSLERVTLFSDSGAYRTAFRPPSATSIYHACGTGDRMFAALASVVQDGRTRPPLRTASVNVMLMHANGSLTSVVRDVPAFEVVSLRGAWLPRPMGERALIATSSTALYVRPSGARSVDVYDANGALTRTITLTWRRSEPSPQQRDVAIEELAVLMPEGPARDGFRSELRALPPVESLPHASSLLIDPLEWLWVVAPHPTETVIHAFDSGGQHRGAVHLPGTHMVFEVGLDHLLSGAIDVQTGERTALEVRRLVR